jgi:hypothetical protein
MFDPRRFQENVGSRCSPKAVKANHMGAVHMPITIIGLDIAKNVFQVHGID